ncbi:MAG TPA: AbiV family abortive infection protein [Flavobacteriales bacterium]|nr:AbiV family abortive infection protein [Flavobacteriales bacterium]
MKKTFATITNGECLNVAHGIFEHAKTKWSEAQLLAESGYYSGSLSAKVIALEELTKALILAIDSHGFEFRTLTKLKVLRNDHRDRHLVLLFIAIVDVFGGMLKELLLQFESDPELQSLLVADKVSFERDLQHIFISRYKSSLGPDLVRMSQWAHKLSSLRNASNYSSHDGEFRTPLDLDSDEYAVLTSQLDRSFIMLASVCAAIGKPDEVMKVIINRTVENISSKLNYSSIDEFLGEHLESKKLFEKITAGFSESIDNAHLVFETDRAPDVDAKDAGAS